MRELTYLQALDEAVAEEMRRDERVITLATDFTGNPIKEFGPKRVRFSPISESALTGMGLGAAASGRNLCSGCSPSSAAPRLPASPCRTVARRRSPATS